MPIYIYECTNEDCKARVEKLRSVTKMREPVKCGTCGGEAKYVLSLTKNAFQRGRYWSLALEPGDNPPGRG